MRKFLKIFCYYLTYIICGIIIFLAVKICWLSLDMLPSHFQLILIVTMILLIFQYMSLIWYNVIGDFMNKTELETILKKLIDRIDSILNSKIKMMDKKKEKDYELMLFFNWSSFIMAIIGLVLAWQSLSIVKNVDSKFRPLYLEKSNIVSGTLGLNLNNEYYTLEPLNLPTILKEKNSGDVKKQLIGYTSDQHFNIRDISQSSLITVDLKESKNEEFVEFIPAGLKSNKRLGLIISNKDEIKINLFHIYYVGYANDKFHVTGILFHDNNMMKMQYLYDSEILDSTKLIPLYKNISMNNDPFWKNTAIKDFDSFKNYIITQRKKFIKELEEIGE